MGAAFHWGMILLYWAKPFWVPSPGTCSLWGFYSDWWRQANLHPRLLPAHAHKTSWVLLAQAQVVSSCLSHLERSWALWRSRCSSPELSVCRGGLCLWYSSPWIPAILGSLGSLLCLLNSRRSLGSSFLAHWLQTFSGQRVEAMAGFTLLISCLFLLLFYVEGYQRKQRFG